MQITNATEKTISKRKKTRKSYEAGGVTLSKAANEDCRARRGMNFITESTLEPRLRRLNGIPQPNDGTENLWSKGMKSAENAILTGISAGGLATMLNCDKFKCLLPESAKVSTLFLYMISRKFDSLGSFMINNNAARQSMGLTKNLSLACTSVMEPSLGC
uniref:Pectin acetylesterase n=1 Tax=Solanum lycopersicum TaxID=4081 RepID=A0A3Q7HQV9_SOLLC